MHLNNKAYIYYELIICICILLCLTYFFIFNLITLKEKVENERINYSMKQILYANQILLENDCELIFSDEYLLYYDEFKICIVWNDLYGNENQLCEKIYE